jgi:hypothetical protein
MEIKFSIFLKDGKIFLKDGNYVSECLPSREITVVGSENEYGSWLFVWP